MTNRVLEAGEVQGDRPHGWRTAFSAIGAPLAIAILILLSPLAGGSAPRMIGPPYLHSFLTTYKSTSTSGYCTAANTLNSLHWIPKTGNLTAVATSTAKDCAAPPAGNGGASAFGSYSMQVYIPFKVKTGAHNVTVNMSYALTVVRAAAGKFLCPIAKYTPGSYNAIYCSIYASVDTGWGWYLYDFTNNSYLYGTNTFVQGPNNYTSQYNNSYCTSSGYCASSNGSSQCVNSPSYYATCAPWNALKTGSNSSYINTGKNCGSFYGGSCHYWYNWTLNGSHKFYIYAFFFIYVNAWVNGYSAGNSIVAGVNAATLGNTGWKINAVTVK